MSLAVAETVGGWGWGWVCVFVVSAVYD